MKSSSHILSTVGHKKLSHFMMQMLIVVGVLFGILVVFAPERAHAVVENHENLPAHVTLHFYYGNTSYGLPNRRCWNGSVVREEGHAQYAWLSTVGGVGGTAVINEGTDSVALWLNSTTAQCDRNIDGAGNLIGRSLQRTRSTSILATSSYGSLSFSSPSVTLNYDCSNMFNLRWVKLCGTGPYDVFPDHQDVTLSGLASLPPGTHTVTVQVWQRMVHQYSGGVYRCVQNPFGTGYLDSIDGLTGSNCGNVMVPVTINIEVQTTRVDAGSCGVTPSLTNLSPNQPFTAAFTATNSGLNGGFVWSVYPPNGEKYRLRRVASSIPGVPAEYDIRGGGVEAAFGGVLRPGRTASWSESFTAPNALGQFTVEWRIYGYNVKDNFHYVGATCAMTINVVAKPYFKVYGGDVSVGKAAPAPPATACTVNAAADIRSWQRLYSGTTYVGSGTQLALFALDSIDGFASGQERYTLPRKNLTFANTGSTVANSTYGGGLNADNMPCADDYWQPSGASGIPSPINPSHNGSYQATGNVTINVNPGGIGSGNHVTIYVNGNAYISNNIRYQPATYGNIGQIPSFRLIVRGNIYVAPGVTELNGTFVALSNGTPNSGKFYTCGQASGAPSPSQLENECRWNFLTVYGSVIADTVKLSRTGGTIEQASLPELYDHNYLRGTTQGPAERFIYTPEFWLTSEFSTGGDSGSYKNQPPVL